MSLDSTKDRVNQDGTIDNTIIDVYPTSSVQTVPDSAHGESLDKSYVTKQPVSTENGFEIPSAAATEDVSTLRKRGPRRRWFLPVALFTIIVLSLASFFLLLPSAQILNALAKITSGSNSGNVLNDLFSINPFASLEQDIQQLQGAPKGRINVLLLGYGGPGHDGAYLTDTQILVSIFPKEKKVATLNIPRDTYVSDNGSFKKINTVFADAEQRNPGSGQLSLVKLLSKELATEINYWATIDFTGFKDLVDKAGGIELYVRNTFTDYEYPDGYGYMYPAPTFTQGWSKLTSQQALIYSRSRHAAGPEGGDFARSLRQREVTNAIVKKFIEQGVLTDLNKTEQILEVLSKHLRTNISIKDTYTMGRMFKEYNLGENVVSWTLDDGTGILCPQNSPETGYILVYCDGAYFGTDRLSTSRKELQKSFANILDTAIATKIKTTKVGLLSNQSSVLSTLQKNLKSLNVPTVLVNNQYKEIKLTTNPKIQVYYLGEENLDVYEYLHKQNLGLALEKAGKWPETKTLPKAFADVDIVYWVE